MAGPHVVSRRAALGLCAAGVAFAAAHGGPPAPPAPPANPPVNPRARASGLKITDLRCAVLTGIPMGRVPIIRIDTNQGISGLGEVRDGASPKYALMLKSRLLGENPCGVDRLFRKIKQFGGHGRFGGGVSGVEMALWDLAGKAYDVPAYQLLGGKFRDRVRLYADTTTARDPAVLARRLKARLDRGFTVLKMDLGIDLLDGVPGALARPLGPKPGADVSGPFSGIELTPKGIDALCAHMSRAREAVGADVPLALDHFGPIGVNSCIRLGRALEKFAPAWLEDPIPWQHTALLRSITDAVDVPVLTGEDVYLKEEFQKLVDARAIDMVHPDLMTAGGLLETKKIGDLAGAAGVPMVLHHAGSPVSFAANLHVAAATENFHSLEFHAAEVDGWSDLVTGARLPLVDGGWGNVPDGPGLGVVLNDDACRRRLHPDSQYFAPTPEWDARDAHDRTWS